MDQMLQPCPAVSSRVQGTMDPEDFDQTQAIAFDDQDFNDDTDELGPEGEKKPAGYLKVLLQKGLNETSHPLYEGDNIIGRNQDTCHVYIPSKSLSKEHACIQIVADVHMLFDKGSRNKTRRGKLILSPEVRYELRNNEELMFADVKCVYQIANELDTVAESGSDTEGSESLMLKYDISGEASLEAAGAKGNLTGTEAENNDDDSVLPPTQSYPTEHSRSKVIVKDTPESAKQHSKPLETDVPLPTLVLSESESEGEEEEEKVAQTQDVSKLKLLSKQAEVQATLLCEDSDPESSRDKFQFMAATQAYGVGGEDNDDTEDETSRQSLIGAATQAYGLTRDGAEHEGDGDKRLLDEPTQAFSKVAEDTEDSKPMAATQSFRLTGKTTGEGKETEGNKELNTSDSSAAATQIFEEEEDDDENGASGAALFAAATMACDDIIDDEETDNEEKEDGGGSEDATQVFDENAPTQKIAFKKDENGNSDTINVQNSSKKGKITPSETLVIDDCQTVPVPQNKTAKPATPEAAKSNRSNSKIGQKDLPSADAPTQVIQNEGDTLHLKTGDEEGKESDNDGETQVFGDETVPVENLNARKTPAKPQLSRKTKGKGRAAQPREAAVETVPVEDSSPSLSDKTQARNTKRNRNPVADTLVISEGKRGDGLLDEPTQLFAENNDQGQEDEESVKEQGERSAASNNEPTQDFVTASGDLPTQVFAPDDGAHSAVQQNRSLGSKQFMSKVKRSTLAISSDEEDDSGNDNEKPWLAANANEATQAYLSGLNKEIGGVAKTISIEEEATQAYSVHNGDDSQGEEAEEQEDKPGLVDEPTQAYGLVADAEDLDDEDATQAFENLVEDEDDNHVIGAGDPTQKYDMLVRESSDPTQQEGKGEEVVENSDDDDDSDLEEKSVLKMDQVVEALADADELEDRGEAEAKLVNSSSSSPQVSVSGVAQQSDLVPRNEEKSACDLSEPPLSPEIPDRSTESTPVFAVPVGEKELSDTEEMVPDSMALGEGENETDAGSKSMIPLPLPARSPLKSALVTRKRSPSPAAKCVNFSEAEPQTATPEKEEEKPTARKGRGRRSQGLVDSAEEKEPVNSQKGLKAKIINDSDQREQTEVNISKIDENQVEMKTRQSRTYRGASKRAETVKNLSDSEKDKQMKDESNMKNPLPDVSTKESPSKPGTNLSEKSSSQLSPSRVLRRQMKDADDDNKVPVESVEERSAGCKPKEMNLEDQNSRSNMTKSTEQTSEGNRQTVVAASESHSTEELEKPAGKIKPRGKNAKTISKGETEQKSTPSGRRGKPGATLTEGSSDSATGDLDASPSLSGGRVSSRGRRITNSSHLKDYDTSVRGKGRKSVLSPSPNTEAGTSSESSVDTSHTKSKPGGSAAEEIELPVPLADARQPPNTAASEETKAQDSAQVKKGTGRGRRRKNNEEKNEGETKTEVENVVIMQTELKDTSDGNNGSTPKPEGSNEGDEVSGNRSKRGGNGRQRGKKSTVVVEEKDDAGSVRGDNTDFESIVSEEREASESGTQKLNTRKTRGHMTKADSGSVEGKDGKKDEPIAENVSARAKRGRKSAAVLEIDADVTIKKAKKDEVPESREETEETNNPDKEKGAGRRQRNARAQKTEVEEQTAEMIRAAGADLNTSAATNQKTKRGRMSSRAAAASDDSIPGQPALPSGSDSISQSSESVANRKSSRTLKMQDAVAKDSALESDNMTSNASSANDTRGRGKGRKSAVVGSSSSAIKSEGSNRDVQGGETEAEGSRNADKRKSLVPESQSLTGQAKRQSSRASVAAGGKAAVDQEEMDVSECEQASQSSASTRGRRGGGKRSAVTQELVQQEESRTLTKSTRRGLDKKETLKDSAGVLTSSQTKQQASTPSSQPSSSPAKKSRRSSPPPSTPSRKSGAAIAVASSPAPTSSPSLRKSTVNNQPKVMFTGVIDDQGEKIVKELGGELVSKIQDCSHLITDKVRRTVKFLGGLAKGALIVTPQWLESSKQARTFLDGHKFLVKDPAMEKQYKFSLQSSIERAGADPLLQGYSLYVTPSVRPDPTQMKDILICAGAKVNL
ncbi:mediator of DNA damage checkpoint protein 1 [Plakobranchus ocellatus]|uniref:Mediator of DNA damage checkpoint protein 1 n=1 Tax=Plakobranchus ocellatus TaxID=259542 RepID=A0AAV3YGE9_9GAST|nr:mediator of DNA damage checkpoint protein 1 [Plakobranchus ocellatus]